jgi:hypothetical protein
VGLVAGTAAPNPRQMACTSGLAGAEVAREADDRWSAKRAPELLTELVEFVHP